MTPASSVMGEIMFVAMRSDTASPMELKSTADWIVRRRVMSVPGIAEVMTIGGDERQVQLLVDPARLSARRHRPQPGGRGDEQWPAPTRARASSVENGQELLIEGVGRAARTRKSLAMSWSVKRAAARAGARSWRDPHRRRAEARHRGVQRQACRDPRHPEAAGREHARTDRPARYRIRRDPAHLPQGMVLETKVFPPSGFHHPIGRQRHHRADRRDWSLVAIIVFIFLVSWRATAVALAAIPVSVVSAIIVINSGGGTINTMTSGRPRHRARHAGRRCDHRGRERGPTICGWNARSRRRAGKATSRSSPPPPARFRDAIIFATLIILLVFLPIFGLTGIEGRLLQPLALAYGVSLLASLAVALTLTPALSYDLLSRKPSGCRATSRRMGRPNEGLGMTACCRYAGWTAGSVLAVASLVMVVAAGIGIALAGRVLPARIQRRLADGQCHHASRHQPGGQRPRRERS